MVEAWIGFAVGVVLLAFGVWAVAFKSRRIEDRYAQEDKKFWVIGGIVAAVVGLALIIGPMFWLYGTEGGARAQKTWTSDTGGGLTREVEVFDMQGHLIKRYEGKFDVDANDQRIIFDIPQPDGSSKRVQIWSSTGTVAIEEK